MLTYGGVGGGTYGGAGSVITGTFSGTGALTGGTSQWDSGTVSAPSIAFAAHTQSGFYDLSGAVGVTFGGSAGVIFNFDAIGQIKMGSGGSIAFTSTASAAGAGPDTVLSRGSAGVFKFASANSFSANGSVATVLGSVGPTGSHTTVQKWLTLQDSGGVVGYIPIF